MAPNAPRPSPGRRVATSIAALVIVLVTAGALPECGDDDDTVTPDDDDTTAADDDDSGPGDDDDSAPVDDSLTAPFRVDVGADATDLLVQFAASDVVDGTGALTRIWTRSYGLSSGEAMIPGPTFYFSPGDLLQITLNNMLDADAFTELAEFEQLEDTDSDLQGDVFHEAIHSEVNFPHNADNTNLHTHGLHVDPNRDDVTLIVIPPDDSPGNYADELQPFIKQNSWDYVYRIPTDHLPGTHWYHAHKHGSTSVHVENGMAGALIIEENAGQEVIPGIAPADDRVMILQMLANYGISQGEGTGHTAHAEGSSLSAGSPFVAVNGKHLPDLALQPHQVQRWRFVNAAANHQSFSHLWVGKRTGNVAADGTVELQEVPVYLVALDGVTLSEAVQITADNPLFIGPGNRADVVASLPEGDYMFVRGFPKVNTDNPSFIGVSVVNEAGDPVTPTAEIDQMSNPYLLPQESATEPNFAAHKVDWMTFGDTGAPIGPATCDTPPCAPVVPLISVAEADGGGGNLFTDITYSVDFPSGKWQPFPPVEAGGGGTGAQVLYTVTVAGDPISPDGLDVAALNTRLEGIGVTSPTAASIPAYASPFTDADILQSRAVVFDISGVTVHLPEEEGSTQKVRQFTLNGRQFQTDDSVGNPVGPDKIAAAPSEPEGILLTTLDRSTYWNNTYWTNPGYYSDVELNEDHGAYQYEAAPGPPTLEQITGLPAGAMLNPGSPKAADVPGPGEPFATSAEEWTLINNTPVGHPFHIHINPFLVQEVGQLSYETFDGGEKGWAVRTINPEQGGAPTDATTMPKPTGVQKLTGTSDMWWVVNNWWDTIVIPPHGYVKMRYWINVPQQSPDSSSVTDDTNREASWVYHCHTCGTKTAG